IRIVDGESGAGAVLAEIPVPALAPGQAAALSASWTPSVPGERTLSAVVDADDDVVEADEGNNLARRVVVVQNADFYVTAPYVSPDGDGIQDQTTLAYRAGSPVDVIVSDERGQAVRVLAEGAPAEGMVTWDGRDDHGRLLWDG